MLDCKDSSLKRVPDIPDDVIVVDLKNNDISELFNDSFENCSNVRKLDLSNNFEISVIRSIMLRGMPNLEEIVLNDMCGIRWNEQSFPDDTFENLTRLTSVSLQRLIRQCPRDLTMTEFDFMMHKLPKSLVNLSVTIPVEGGFSEKLMNFTRLKKLEIQQSMLEMPITITNDTFECLKNVSLETLTIKFDNQLSGVEPLAFYYLPKLKSLDMSGTSGISIADFYPALIGLQNTTIEYLRLSSMQSNYIFSSSSVATIFGPTRKQLVWAPGQGVTATTSSWRAPCGPLQPRGPPRDRGACGALATPLFSSPVFLNGSFCENLVLPNLRDLQLDHTQLFAINKSCFISLPNLKVLNLSFNSLSMEYLSFLFENLWSHKNLTELDISNQGGSIGSRAFLCVKLPPNLTKMDMSGIWRYVGNMPITLYFYYPNKLEYVTFRSNSISRLYNVRFPDNIQHEHLVSFDFSGNNMISFAGSFATAILRDGLRVNSLLLSGNRLGGDCRAGDTNFVFRYFTNLTVLDLSSNDIKTLPQYIFANLSRLKYLNLSMNSLRFVHFRISHMKNLHYLDLSENLISQFEQEFQMELQSSRSSSPNFTVNMLSNPFQCSCDTRSFFWWMHEKRDMFSQFENYSCTYNNNLTTFDNIEQLLHIIDFNCSTSLIVKVTTSLFVFIVFVISLSIFIYRHKWSVLKFFLLEYITNRKLYRDFEESEGEYAYDAFVSFHSDDQDWVWNELHENLGKTDDNVETDDQPRFRLCIHERDFVPGELIEENILKSIESSRKTIVVLSRNFMKSAWCEFELQIARKECIERGRDLIIAVMLEPLAADIKISRSVERLIRKNTYIEWPADQSGRINVWNRMKSVLTK